MTTLRERYDRAEQLVEQGEYDKSVPLLQDLQKEIAEISLISKNDELEDVSTQSLSFVRLDHLLAISLTRQSGNPLQPGLPSNAILEERLNRLRLACDLWENFLQKLDRFELVEKAERDEMERLFEYFEAVTENQAGTVEPPFLQISRDTKIQRLKFQQQIKQERQKLSAMSERRKRLGIQETEEMDGYDDEGLQRETELASIRFAKLEALEELASSLREIPMLKRMTTIDVHDDPRKSNLPPTTNGGGLKLTHINKDPSGRIVVREELRQQVFRPGWNQPTMSLEELAEIEVQQAMERSEKQKHAEEQQKEAPRRYKQLEKDGMEDRIDLVDASAELDRKWDDWKDENPRGSGNKRGDVGDRNF